MPGTRASNGMAPGEMMRFSLGRHVFRLAAILFVVITFVWRDFNNCQQIQALGNVPRREILVYLAAAIEISVGVAIQFRKTARMGAVLSVNASISLIGLRGGRSARKERLARVPRRPKNRRGRMPSRQCS
jgi:hypothetical protein